jgi:hypothetical protein
MKELIPLLVLLAVAFAIGGWFGALIIFILLPSIL